MAAKIRVLDEDTINKIAAGEVIENPASVVKELVDNSIDSGATEISIEIREGGRQLIRVIDNGCGMNNDDAILCLERHATSKIRSVEEIFSTETMGFRGEAIPSIASISKFTLLTRVQGSKETEGSLVIVEGGKLIKNARAACTAGTTVEVRSLFFNVPVRRKFQKSPVYDTQEIVKLVTWLALVYPHIHFKLSESPKTFITTPLGSNAANIQDQLSERIKTLLGSGFHDALVPLNESSGSFHLNGFIGIPSHHRPNRTGQFLCINKRPVFFSPLISNAVKEGFSTMLPAQRYPVFVLHFSLPKELVDANVHPQKREVRLRQEQALKEFLRSAILHALQHSEGSESKERLELPLPLPQYNFSLPLPQIEDLIDVPVVPLHTTSATHSLPMQIPEPPKNYSQISIQSARLSTVVKPKEIVLPEVLTTLPGYILTSGFLNSESPFVLVDQTAARSRIIFEQLTTKTGVASQGLLIPHAFTLTPTEAAQLEANLSMLQTMGFSIYATGPASFMLDALPQCMSSVVLEALVVDVVTALQEKSVSETIQEKIFKRLSTLAARSASEKRCLSIEESRLLLKQLFTSQTPHYCPQGKSILAPLKMDDLQRFFNSLTKG